MPFGSYQESPQVAFRNAVPLMAAGAQMVKIEGGAGMADTTRYLVARGIPVCAHVGLTPQSVHQLGGYRVQGKDASGAAQLVADSLAHQEAGAAMVLMEAVPAPLAAEITAKLSVPTIGIGAGARCDGQVLVWSDMAGMTDWRPRFAKQFGQVGEALRQAALDYAAEVREGAFPAREHWFDS